MPPSFASDRFSAQSISSAGLQEGRVAIAEGKENQRECICGEFGACGWESEDKPQTLSRAGAQWCSLSQAVCASPPRRAFGCSRGHTQVSSSLLWCIIAEPWWHPSATSCAPQTPVLAVPQSRGQEGTRGAPLTELLFSFSSWQRPGWPAAPLCDLTRTPELCCTPPCPLRGSGKSLLFLFYNITWFCKCCFLFRYRYFLLLKV